MIGKMNGSAKVRTLAEHYAISKTPLARGLKVINTERATVPMREKIYAQGGILSVTSRILVVDLLSKLLDPEKITGIVVLHADRYNLVPRGHQRASAEGILG
jgi:hypothetical protein